MKLPKGQFIIIDTEYTAWDGSMERGWTGPNEYRELVQLVGIRVDSDSLEEIDSFNELVKPIRNPILSKYFVELTKIDQKRLDENGKSFTEVIAAFTNWSKDDHIFSWGNDEAILFENCGFVKIPSPIPLERFSDVRSLFLEKGIQARMYMSSTIIKAFKQINPHAMHDAINDARGILLALRELKKR